MAGQGNPKRRRNRALTDLFHRPASDHARIDW